MRILLATLFLFIAACSEPAEEEAYEPRTEMFNEEQARSVSKVTSASTEQFRRAKRSMDAVKKRQSEQADALAN